MSKACQLFSGSSGNSIWIASGETKILVDAGVSAKRIEQALMNLGESAGELSAILVTHEHADHISGVRVLASRYGIPVLADSNVLLKMYEDGKLNDKVITAPIEATMSLDGVEIKPFALSHDSVACYGYRFNLPDGRSVAVCTDTGYITAAAKDALTGCDLVFLESNHEVMMLENGPYPYLLKQRILSRKGHLSNSDCAAYATELVSAGTTRLVLSHLSRENNFPEIARQTTVAALTAAGFKENTDYRLRVSAPENRERPILL
ncbi:MAG: MBL fold metallo-hydrolase [Eubacterium sp.]|nr:MBL fold metallo-hydrolase [Eubacterium sp.]